MFIQSFLRFSAQQSPASFSCLQCLVAVGISQLDTTLYEAALAELAQFNQSHPEYVTIAQAIFMAAIKVLPKPLVPCNLTLPFEINKIYLLALK